MTSQDEGYVQELRGEKARQRALKWREASDSWEQAHALGEAEERLCLGCKHYTTLRTSLAIYSGPEGSVEQLEAYHDEVPACAPGLKPLTSDGADCPYREAQ